MSDRVHGTAAIAHGAEAHDDATAVRVRDWLLYALTASSGAIDTISFLSLGRVFSAFMTGNIAFLGMRVSRAANAPGVVDLLASLFFFAVGTYVAARIVMARGDSGIWDKRVTVTLGFSLFGHVLFVALWLWCGAKPSTDLAHVLLGSWAFASGMQAVAVRSLHVVDVTSTAATGTVLGFVAALVDLPTTGPEVKRLAGGLASLFVGAAAGGVLLLNATLYAPLLPLITAAAVVSIAANRFGPR